MGITVSVTRVACTIDTPPYTQDITTADLSGLTPKAALFIVSGGITDGTAADEARLSFGAATGSSNRWALCGFDEHNVATSNTIDAQSTVHCVFVRDPGVTIASADFDSFITNGVRIEWDVAPPSAYLLTVVLFAGTDLSAHANNVALGNTIDLTADVTAPGFEPDNLICSLSASASQSNNWRVSNNAGFAYNDGVGGVTQRAHAKYWEDNKSTARCWARSTNSGAGLYCSNSGALDYYVEISDFDSNGFSATPRNSGANNNLLCYLALAYNGAVDSWVGTHTTPTSTGNDSETGPGFTPQAVILIENLLEAIDTAYSDNRAGAFGLSAFDADNEYSTVVAAEDGVATTNTQSLSDDRAIVLTDDDGTLDIEATFVSFDANGWTVNYSNAPATAKLFFALAIEGEAAPPAGNPWYAYAQQ